MKLSAISPAQALTTGYSITGWRALYYEIPDLTDIAAIEAGHNYTIALRIDGTVVGWGIDDRGQVDIPVGLSDVVAISAGRTHDLALKSDGTVVGWGENDYGQATPLPGLTGVVAGAAGMVHSLALKSDGTVVGWGYNNYGALDIAPDLTDVVAIAASDLHSLALKSDGTIVGWGENRFGESTPPAGLTDVIAIDAGYYYSLAPKSGGTVVAWGWNQRGETDVPAGLADVVAIAAGYLYSLALKSDGTVVAWGDNGMGQINVPANLIGAVAIAAGTIHSLALVPAVVNTAPTANPGGPYLGAINTAISFDGSGSSDADGDALTYTWTFGDGSTGTGVTPSRSYAAAGIYDVCLKVNDITANSPHACTLAVVHDPSAGSVTGGGWIDSPAGACKADPALVGKATFGFVSKYKRGASVPTDNTQFQFDVAGLSFYSEAYEWLVVNQGGTNAQFKGTGMINGSLDSNGNPYRFMLWAGDGATTGGSDTFHIQIWWEGADAVEYEVYDNGLERSGCETGQPIGGGSIVVHTRK